MEVRMNEDRVFLASLAPLRRASELRRHRCNEIAFARTFSTALRNLATDTKEPAASEIRTFLGNVVTRLVASPSDLVALCTLLNDDVLARAFMRLFVRHELADRDVIFGLVDSPATWAALPDDQAWMEVVVLLYGANQLNSAGGRKVKISEIAPLGIEVEKPVVRSLVGSAFDEGILDEADVARLLDLFPADPYFRAKLVT
jgi:hypothetical protein